MPAGGVVHGDQVAVDHAHLRAVGGQLVAQPGALGGSRIGVAAKAVRLEGGVSLRGHPAIAPVGVEDVRGAPAGHRLHDGAALPDHDVGPCHLHLGLAGAGAVGHREALQPQLRACLDHQIVAPASSPISGEQHAPGRGVERPRRDEALGVHRMRQAHGLRREGQRAGPALRPVAQNHDGGGDALEVRRGRTRRSLGVHHEDLRHPRIPVGELVCGRCVLREDRVAPRRQLVVGHRHPHAPPAGVLDRLAVLDGMDRDLVPQVLQLLGDRHQVGLRAAEPDQLLRAEDELHGSRGEPSGRARSPSCPRESHG